MFITYYIFILGITVVQFLISRYRNGKNPENSFEPLTLFTKSFFNCFWPVYLVVLALEYSFIGQILPESNYNDVQKADSLRSAPNSPSQYANRGGNISNNPDQL
jgi:hypothetical protein